MRRVTVEKRRRKKARFDLTKPRLSKSFKAVAPFLLTGLRPCLDET